MRGKRRADLPREEGRRLRPGVDLAGPAPSLIAFAREIAEDTPGLAVDREQMRGDLAAAVRTATDREDTEQFRLQQTDDYAEGVRAVAERRPGDFSGR